MTILFLVMIFRGVNTYLENKKKWSFLEINVLFYIGIVGSSMFAINCWDKGLTPYLYPVIASFTLGLIFTKSLLSPPSLIERLARITEPNLNADGVAYTRKVTLAWALFCFINGLLSAATALWTETFFWTLYNGVISYCLMGVMLVTEYIIRCMVKSQKKAL